MTDFDLPPPDEGVSEEETQLLPLPDGVTSDTLFTVPHPDPVVRMRRNTNQTVPQDI